MAAAVALLLAGCGFSPMYGEHAGGGLAARGWQQVAVAPPATRVEQLVYKELLRNRPPEQHGGGTYLLRLQVSDSEAVLMSNRLNRVRLTVNYTLADRANGKVLTQGKAFADASYRPTRLHFADARAKEDAQRSAARLVADDIRRRVSAFLARGMPMTGKVAPASR